MNSQRRSLVFIATLLCFAMLAILVPRVDAYTCFGVEATAPEVCSGNGYCQTTDVCVCNSDFQGSICNTPMECGWTSNSLGAPNPSITAQVTPDNRVLVTVKVSKKVHVNHTLALSEPLTCSSSLSADQSTSWSVVEDTSCFVTYLMNRTLQEHLNDNKVEKVFTDGDIFEARANIYAAYQNYEEEGSCQLTVFKTAWTVKVFLQGVSAATFESTNTPIGIVRQDTIRVQTDGKLEIQATLTLNTEGKLSNFSFASSSTPSLSFTIQATAQDSNCGDSTLGVCKYTLVMVSTVVLSDYSGKHNFKAILTRDATQQEVAVDLSFDLLYSSPVPPPVTSVNITTQSSFYASDFATQKSVFTVLEDAWMLTETTPRITIASRALALRNVYLCCMKNRESMPEYNPTDNKLGCTVQTSAMSIWAQLVDNEVPLTAQFNVKVKKLPFIDDKIGMTFSLLPLVGESRLCYMHVESFLKQNTRSALEEQQEVNRVISYSPLQVLLSSGSTGGSNVDKTPSSQPQAPASAASINSTGLWSFAILALFAILSLCA